MAVGAVIARILTQYSDKGSKAARKDIDKLGKQFDDFAKKTTRAFGVAAVAAGALAIKLGKDAVRGAMEDQKAQASLALALRNTTNANDAVIASTVSYLDKLELSTGINNDQLIPSLQKLVTVTGDLNVAQRLQQIALDVSAGTTKELSAVTDTFVRALNGNLGAFKKLGISLDDTIIKNKDLTAAFDELSKTFAGQAATRAETFEFRMLRLQLAFDQALDSLGYAFLPVLEDFVDTLNKNVLPQIAKWIELNKRGLAEGLRSAAEAALQLIQQMLKIGAWIVANFNTIKNFAILMASLWATAKVYNFITAIGKLTLAFRGMQAAAAGAAVAGAAATGATGAAGGAAMAGRLATVGAGGSTLGWAALIAAPIAAAAYFVKKEGNKIRANKAKVEASLAGYTGAPGPSDLAALTGTKKSKVKVDKSMQAYLDFLNKLQKVEDKSAKSKKELTKRQEKYNKLLKDMGIKTTEQQDAITQFAIRANLLKQASITGSPLTSIGSPTPMNMAYAGMNQPINVYVQGSVISERDLVDTITKAQQKQSTIGTLPSSKYLGSGGGAGGTGGRFTTQVI